jgi:hypothetical protein
MHLPHVHVKNMHLSHGACSHILPVTSRKLANELHTMKEKTMKTIVSALVALSILTGFVGSASAFDAKSFWAQQDREHS